MLVYNSESTSNKQNNLGLIFKHLSISKRASAERVEGMFALQKQCKMTSNFVVYLQDYATGATEQKTIEQYLNSFCEYARLFSIYEYEFESKNPLRIIDLWEDDPIGSGGPKVIADTTIKLSWQKEINTLFQPFTDVIYPHHTHQNVSKKDLKKIMKRYANNPLFLSELRKRKTRSAAIGEDFTKARHQELVWLDLTFKLKTWAVGKGYDSFVYTNDKEGGGADTYVTLLPNQLKRTGNRLVFNTKKYMDEAPNSIRQELGSSQKSETRHHMLWGGNDPTRYWT